jgi:hypothetical protein
MSWSSRRFSPVAPCHLPISKPDNSRDVCTIKLNEGEHLINIWKEFHSVYVFPFEHFTYF